MRKAKMAQQWWAVDVSCSDYNSLSMLARVCKKLDRTCMNVCMVCEWVFF